MPNNLKKILVVDGNSIINRAFFGVRPLSTKNGQPTNAVFGMMNIIKRNLDYVHPDYAAVAFDVHQPTFRHLMYDGYKAGRHETPPDLIAQFDEAKACLRLLGFHVLELPGYEADDIQGTVAKMAHTQEDTEAFILSGDRDLLQLIDDKVTVLLATNAETLVMTEVTFREKYGIPSSDFVDMKALMGDSSDNIPGVSGVGEKTAQSLIARFSNLENIYENIESPDISKGVREKLLRGRDNAFLSRTLARIRIDAPIGMGLSDLAYRGVDKAGLARKFSELELYSLIPKFGLNEKDPVPPAPAPSTPAKAEVCTEATAQKLAEVLPDRFAMLLREETFLFYAPACGLLSFSGNAAELEPLFASAKDVTVFEGKPLWHRLRALGLRLSPDIVWRDLSLYAYLFNPGSGASKVSGLASMFLSEAADDESFTPDLLWRLEVAMKKKIDEDGLGTVLEELELPLLPILARTEEIGFQINRKEMLAFSDALGTLAGELTTTIYMRAGKSFNINSPKQLGEVLFEDMGLPCYQKKKKNGYSTDAETLEELRAVDPIIDDILEYRQVTKLRGTYAQALPQVADENDRIHTEFKQAMTATGRLSSADPNLQNIPVRTKMGRQMRHCFVGKEGYTLVDADYSQIELRLLAAISGDEAMTEAFLFGADIHKKTASAVFGIPEEAVTDEMRKRAKAVNFGIVYGISGFSLANDIGTTTKEAQKYIDSYLASYPKIAEYLVRVVEEAKACGYSVTPMGRRRYIPELNAANGNLRAFGKRVAMNAPIQGAAADVMKAAMIRTDRALREAGLDAAIVMQVHDELIVEVRDDQAARCAAILKEAMESAVTLPVPLPVEVAIGKNWLDMEVV